MEMAECIKIIYLFATSMALLSSARITKAANEVKNSNSDEG